MNSIGIIGGSDGPTTVLFAVSTGAKWLFGGLILLLAAGILFLALRHKKK